MTKQEFLAELRKGLSVLPQGDIEERLNFYSEMIDDRMEEGLSETEAVSEIGSVDATITQILEDTPPTRTSKNKVKPNRVLKAWEIVLIILGSPIWVSLLIAAVVVAVSLYISLWCVIISLWAVFGSLIGCAFGGAVAGILFAAGGKSLSGIAIFSAGIVCAGLSVFMFYGCKAATKGILLLTEKMVLGVKSLFVGKEAAQ